MTKNKKDFQVVEDDTTIRLIIYSNGGNITQQQKLISQIRKSKKEIVCEIHSTVLYPPN